METPAVTELLLTTPTPPDLIVLGLTAPAGGNGNKMDDIGFILIILFRTVPGMDYNTSAGQSVTLWPRAPSQSVWRQRWGRSGVREKIHVLS